MENDDTHKRFDYGTNSSASSSLKRGIAQDSSTPSSNGPTTKDGAEGHDRRDTVETADDSQADEQHYMADPNLKLGKSRTHTLGILKLRAQDDNDPVDWWFASTAIPLIAATFAPMANMLSIAALVVNWRANVTRPDDPALKYFTAEGIADPHWCVGLNAASLVCGFVGNLFLLFNFTKRVRYIIALPVTIIFFYLASGILIAIIVCMYKYAPANSNQVYSQGFWHGIIAACLYMLNSMILMVNMWGYFLGHYPQNFTLSDEHRNLILQTMLFFLWLSGGAGVFARTEHWLYPDALYFCDVTILTIGFGDFYAQDDLGKGLVFPYSVGGTIILGLMVSSIHKFARELSREKVIRKHVETERAYTLDHAVTIEDLDDERLRKLASGKKLSISRPVEADTEQIQGNLDALIQEERRKREALGLQDADKEEQPNNEQHQEEAEDQAGPLPSQFLRSTQVGGVIQKSLRTLTFPIVKPVTMTTHGIRRVMTKNQKRVLMLQERDRFNAMRSIQSNAATFKKYYALTMSIISFSMLWCLGAMVFFFAEKQTQDLNYFQALYFCYVSLLTIGYGDLSPKSNAGKAFFVLWSLIAVPTMTILVSDLGDTVIGGFKRGVLKNDLGLTSKSSDNNSPSTWRSYLARLFRAREDERKVPEEKKPDPKAASQPEVESGRPGSVRYGSESYPIRRQSMTLEELVDEDVSDAEMMRRLAFAIRQTADDLKKKPSKKYSYEEWVQFTRLIKFSKFSEKKVRSGEASAMEQVEYDEEADGVVEWDWLDANSPMTSELTESEWVLDRLCESLLRVFKKSDLALGGVDEGQIVRRPGMPEKSLTTGRPGMFEDFTFGDEDRELSPSTKSRTLSEPRVRGTDVMKKMTKFFQGENMDDDTPQWSKRAKTKMGQTTGTEDSEPRDSREGRRSSLQAMFYRRRGSPVTND